MGWRCWQIVTEHEEKSSVEAFAFDWDLILTEMIVMFLMLLLSNFTFKFNDVLRKFLWAFEAEHNTLSSVLEIATSPITFSLFFSQMFCFLRRMQFPPLSPQPLPHFTKC